MSLDINKILHESILEEAYNSDASRKTIKFFEERKVNLKELLYWQEKYPIIFPWDAKYNTNRLGFNRVGQFFPKFIVMVKRKRDAQWALETAKQYNIEFSIKSGGHDSQNYSLSDGIIIDLTNRNHIKMNDDYTIKIGAGVRIGFLVEELNKHNRFMVTGSCLNVGVTGLTLGGGIGFLRRKYGLTLDHLLTATIVLADGNIVKCDKNQNSDLFWALLGGGSGSFGIVTDLTFMTHKMDKLVLFELWIPFKYFTKVFDIWQRFNFEAPRNLTSFLQLFSPNNKENKEPILVAGQFLGKKSELTKLLSIFGDMPSHRSMHYKDLMETGCCCAVKNPPFFYKYLNLMGMEYLSIDTIKGIKKIMKNSPTNGSIEIDGMGGKLAEIKNNETAFFWRQAKFWLNIRSAGDTQSDIPNMEKWVQSTYHYLLNSGMKEQSYCNFKNPNLTKEQYPLVYWGENAKKLSKIKRKYDPDDIFHFAQSVPLKL